MPDYGGANRSLEEMEAGARVEVAPYKKAAMALRAVEALEARRAGVAPRRAASWRRAGRGGAWSAPPCPRSTWVSRSTSTAAASTWCSPHENEIAQSRCAHGTAVMANVWMHNGFLQVEGEKMSKSLGNFVTIRELLQEWPGEAIKLAMLSAHYRQPINASNTAGMVEASARSTIGTS